MRSPPSCFRTILALVVASSLLGSLPAVARANDATSSPADPGRPTPEPHRNWLAPPKPVWPLVPMVLVAGAGLAVSIVYALKVSSDQGPVDSARFQLLSKYGGPSACIPPSSAAAATCSALQSSQNVVNTDNTLMVVGGVVAGTAVVGAVLYYLLGPGKTDPADTTIGSGQTLVPWLGAGSTGVSFSGRF